MSIEKWQLAGEWREAGEHLIWVGREKVSQYHKIHTIDLATKTGSHSLNMSEAGEKVGKSKLSAHVVGASASKLDQTPPLQTATLCHVNTLLIWQPPLEFCSWNNLILGVFAHLLKGASKSDPQRQHNYRNGKVKAAVMQSWSSLRINFPLQNSAAFCVVAYIGL